MSFNVGPTLMSWLEQHAEDVHAALIAADRASRERFGGHGSAMAQAYNHMIMPLASPRDRATQVKWGIADFRKRFGRAPEGMWLPECAVDTASLENLAAEGIAFTVLAPHQAKAWRPPGGEWRTSPVDPGRAYKYKLPSGRTIDLFFYDGATAQAVAFERLLADGHQIIERMINRGPAEGNEPTLCHIATDGETYGHHHRYGDMALAWALTSVEEGWKSTRLTNYAEFRAKVPATWEVQLQENSSWSCAHGASAVARRLRLSYTAAASRAGTRSGAGRCATRSTGVAIKPRAHSTRSAACCSAIRGRRATRTSMSCSVAIERSSSRRMRRTRSRLTVRAPRTACTAQIVEEPAVHQSRVESSARARTAVCRARADATHAAHPLAPDERVRALSLMEMARHAMLMYTSCGWFFDDLSGIETVQCMQYAARVAELVQDVGGHPVEPELVDRLSAAVSNLPDEGNGRRVWSERVRPARIDPSKICAHVAVHTLVEPDPKYDGMVHAYEVELVDRVERRSGRTRMVAAGVRVKSALTEATTSWCFAGLYLGEQHVTGGVRPPPEPGEWTAIVDELLGALKTADVFAAQRAIDRHFPGAQLSLGALLPGSRERVIEAVLGDALHSAEEQLGDTYDQHVPLVRWLVAHELPVPEVLHAIAEGTLRRRVLANLHAENASFPELRNQLAEAAEVKVSLDTPEIALAASEGLRHLIDRVANDGDLDPASLDTLVRAAEVAARMKSAVDLWFAQNATWRLLERLPELRSRGRAGDTTAAQAALNLERLARTLRLAVPS